MDRRDAPRLRRACQERRSAKRHRSFASAFPDDLNRFADKFIAQQQGGKPISPSQINLEVTRMFVEIQSREADRIETAPAASLKAVLEAQGGLLRAASRDQPQLCVVMATEAEARPSPSQEIGRLSVVRLAAILTALADGRDKPVGARSATDADWNALGPRCAQARLRREILGGSRAG
jgi:hypothetical protein